MKQHRTILALIACASLVAACGASGGGSTPPAGSSSGADAGGSSSGDGSSAGDTTASSSGGQDGTGATDGTGSSSGDGASTSGGDAAGPCDCKAKGAQCGFLPGCSASCGACPVGNSCKENKCTAGNTQNLLKFGEFCGPTKDCQPPRIFNSDDANTQAQKRDKYRACLNAQCATNQCSGNICIKSCALTTDKVINATGDPGKDGVEDPGVDSDCGDAENGPAGDKWRCVELRSESEVAQGQSLPICMAGESFKKCGNSKDCPTGETCQLGYIYGTYSGYCQAEMKTPGAKKGEFSKGVGVGQICNSNKFTGDLAMCSEGLCWSSAIGCVSFCKDDNDCATAPGACKNDKCPDGNTCKTDADCSAWECTSRTIYSNLDQKFNVCWPKPCQADGDCPDKNNYCFLLYNGVKKAEGDPDPNDATKVIKPAWKNMCLPKLPGGAKAGEKCDPYEYDDDETDPDCSSKLLCEDGVCGSLCGADKDCTADQKCSTAVSPLDLDDDDKNGYEAFLPYGLCKPYKGAKGDCFGQSECTGQYCKPLTTKLPASATPTDKADFNYTLKGTCVDSDPTRGKWGDHCGEMNTGTGAKKLCGSGYCFNQQNNAGELIPGICVDMCNGKDDCAKTVTIYQQQYKSYCRSFSFGYNDSGDLRDQMYLPVCWVAGTTESLADCSSNFKCATATETCVAAPIVSGPDHKAKVEYICRAATNPATQANPNPPQPTKTVGQECDLESDGLECKTIYCMADSKAGKGYCSQPCSADADCGTGDGMFCDKNYQMIARRTAANAAVVPMCRKKKSCIACAFDWQCAGGYECTNIGSAGTLAKQVCAPPCKVDADCATTDGGAKCVPAVDKDGKDLGNKVCKPNC